MAPALSKLRENQNAIVGVTGISAALWIIAYGKMNNKRRFVLLFTNIINIHITLYIYTYIEKYVYHYFCQSQH